MTETLATEPETAPVAEGAAKPPAPPKLLETWGQNERMRHVPTITWILEKLDGDVRRTIQKLWPPYHSLPSDDARHGPLEAEFRALCRSLDRLAEAAKHARMNGAPGELGARIHWAVEHAVSSVRSVDASLFGRRFPVQTHERSKAEPVYAALLVVIQHLQRLRPLVLQLDPDLDEKLLEGLVRLETPVDDRMRKPIA
jgi:hypothetical protein